MMVNKQTKILVVDDEESIRKLLQKVLEGQCRTVLMAEGGRKAVELFRRERPDITILDLHMPEVSGLDVLKEIRRMDPSATVFVYSGTAGEAVRREIRDLGARDLIEKTCSLAPLGHMINEVA